MSNVKDTNVFLSKLKNLNKVPDKTILVTVNVIGLGPSIARNEGLEILEKLLDNFDKKSICTEDLVKMAEFVFRYLF